MKSKIINAILVIAMLTCILLPQSAFASDTDNPYYNEAVVLKKLELFQGTDSGFQLDRNSKRIEALVMFIRMLGEEDEALSCTYPNPFTDVPSWAERYAAYAYYKGYTKGLGNNIFGSDNSASSDQYATFLLRALGYEEGANGDFTWTNATELFLESTLISQQDYYYFTNDPTGIPRGGLARMSYCALYATDKSGVALLQTLISSNTVTEYQIATCGDSDLQNAFGISPISTDPDPEPQPQPDSIVIGTPVANGETVSSAQAFNSLMTRAADNIQTHFVIYFSNGLNINSLVTKDLMDKVGMSSCSWNIYGNQCTFDIIYNQGKIMRQAAFSNSIKASLTQDQKTLYSRLETIANQITTTDMSTYQKELAVHDYICREYHYDQTYQIYSINEFLDTNYGVCQSYADTFTALMCILGVDTMTVGGTAGGESHAWNIIKIDGEYYQVDPTWDDPIYQDGKDRAVPQYTYFNLTDTQMAYHDHYWVRANFPSCTGTRYAYTSSQSNLSEAA